METYLLKEDIKVFCAAARSFPYGIGGAMAHLQNMLPPRGPRVFFGLSRRSPDGLIVYKAAASEAYRGEADRYAYETFVIRHGKYLTLTLPDWRGRGNHLGDTFARLLADPRSVTDAECVEWYDGCGKVLCMVRQENG